MESINPNSNWVLVIFQYGNQLGLKIPLHCFLAATKLSFFLLCFLIWVCLHCFVWIGFFLIMLELDFFFFFVHCSYRWWKNAQDSMRVDSDSGSGLDSESKKGVVYSASPASSYAGPMKLINNIFSSDLVFNLRREEDSDSVHRENGEVGVSGRDYALVPDQMWVQALRWWVLLLACYCWTSVWSLMQCHLLWIRLEGKFSATPWVQRHGISSTLYHVSGGSITSVYFQITKYTQSWLRFKMLLILSNLMSWLDCFFVIEVHYVGNLMILKVLNELIKFSIWATATCFVSYRGDYWLTNVTIIANYFPSNARVTMFFTTDMTCCDWSNITFTWFHHWHHYFYAPIITSYVCSCEKYSL